MPEDYITACHDLLNQLELLLPTNGELVSAMLDNIGKMNKTIMKEIGVNDPLQTP